MTQIKKMPPMFSEFVNSISGKRILILFNAVAAFYED